MKDASLPLNFTDFLSQRFGWSREQTQRELGLFLRDYEPLESTPLASLAPISERANADACGSAA